MPVPRRALFAGLSTVDVIYTTDAPPAPNSKNVARRQAVYAGGPATNAAITFSLLGGEATLVSPVGAHALAHVIQAELAAHRVAHLDLAPDFTAVPAVSSIFVTPATGDRIVVSANAAALAGHPKRLPPLDLAEFSIALFDGHHLDALAPLVIEARAAGLTTVLDGGSWKPQLPALLPHFDVVIASANFHPPGCPDHPSVLTFLRDSGVHRAAITRGHQPILLLDGAQVRELAVPQVAAVDTLGAGDICHGAFCAAFEPRQPDFPAALASAARIASLSTTVEGPRAWRGLLSSSDFEPDALRERQI
jgi:sugar/nucleoside kinase (ribokinase family)